MSETKRCRYVVSHRDFFTGKFRKLFESSEQPKHDYEKKKFRGVKMYKVQKICR